MQIKLPIIVKREFDEATQELKTEKGFLEVEIDTTFKAHYKWDREFAVTMDGIDLREYTARVQAMMETKNLDKVRILSLLKLLYCYINSPKLPTFDSFLGMLDVAVVSDILERIAVVLEQVSKTASKN